MSHFQSFLLASLLLSPNYSQTYHQWQRLTRYLDNHFPGGTFPATLPDLKMWVSIRGGWVRGRLSAALLAAQLQTLGIHSCRHRAVSSAGSLGAQRPDFALTVILPASPGRETPIPWASCTSSFSTGCCRRSLQAGWARGCFSSSLPRAVLGDVQGLVPWQSGCKEEGRQEWGSPRENTTWTFLLCWLEEADLRGRLRLFPREESLHSSSPEFSLPPFYSSSPDILQARGWTCVFHCRHLSPALQVFHPQCPWTCPFSRPYHPGQSWHCQCCRPSLKTKPDHPPTSCTCTCPYGCGCWGPASFRQSWGRILRNAALVFKGIFKTITFGVKT